MENELKELTLLTSQLFEEIIQLKEQNRQQALQIKATKEAFQVFSSSINEIIDTLNKHSNSISDLTNFSNDANFCITNLQRALSNLPYEFGDPTLCTDNYFYPHIIDASFAIDEIITNRKSIARFGDGEFAIMMKEERQKFQHLDDRLAARLYEVLHSNEPQLLVAIADNYGSLEKYNEGGKLGIRLYMTEAVREAHSKLLDSNRTYYDAYMSRPYALYADNHTDAPKKRFEHLQLIWQNRDIIFVEGALTRLGVGNNLFDNAHSIQRIIAPPTSSFDKYDEILAASLQYAQPDSLFLLAIGPCAGVLAHDLCKAGYQAVDIGHVDLEYEWFLKGTGGRCEVPTKYNNELYGGDIVEPINDETYNSQIICSFA